MSTMLEKAVIDAAALREAALKNAEAAVIEKYSDQIKDAVNILLEQDDMLDGMEDLSSAPAPVADPIVDQLPLAATEGEDLCPCPDEEEVIEINFDDLMQQMDQDDPVVQSDEAAAEELLGTNPELPEQEPEMPLAESENLNFLEEELKELIEQLTVDIDPNVKSGWAGMSQSQQDLRDEQLLAQEQDTKVKEEKEAMRKAVKDLQENKENLEKELQDSKKETEKLVNLLNQVKDKLTESTNINARLLYTNKALVSDSLNERQKKHIVEALSKAATVEEAKVIFDTLQSGVGSGQQKKKLSESLSEAVSRTSSATVLLSAHAENRKSKKDPTLDRWKTLAGIEK